MSATTFIKGLFAGKSNISAEALRKWNIGFAVLLATQAVAIVLLSAAREVPLTVSFMTTDSLQSKLAHATVFAPGLRQLTMLDLAYLVGVILIISALFRAAAATFCRNVYEVSLKREVNAWRWVEWALVGGLMVVLLGLLAGMYDVASLALVFALIAAMFTAGYGLELQNRAGKHRSPLGKLLATAGIASGVISLLAVVSYMCATNALGNVAFPVHLYWPYIVVVILFAKLVVNTHLALTKKGKWSSVWYAEGWYMALGFVGETVLAWLLFATVLHP